MSRPTVGFVHLWGLGLGEDKLAVSQTRTPRRWYGLNGTMRMAVLQSGLMGTRWRSLW